MGAATMARRILRINHFCQGTFLGSIPVHDRSGQSLRRVIIQKLGYQAGNVFEIPVSLALYSSPMRCNEASSSG